MDISKLSIKERLELIKKIKSKTPSQTDPISADYKQVSEAEKRMWYLHELDPKSCAYSLQFKVNVQGNFQPNRLKKAIQRLINDHPNLNCNYQEKNARLIKIAHKKSTPFYQHKKTTIKETSNCINIYKKKPFNLTTDQLFRVYEFACTEQHYVLFFNIHHIVADGWTINLILKNIEILYENIDVKKNPSPSYQEFISWEEKLITTQQTDHKKFWKNKFSTPSAHKQTIPSLTLHKTSSQNYIFKKINKNDTKKINTFCNENQLTPFTFLSSAFALSLANQKEDETLILGTSFANRCQNNFSSICGLFVNTVPVHYNIKKSDTFINYLFKQKHQILKILDYHSFPLNEIVKAANVTRTDSTTPVFDILFTYQHEAYPIIEFENTKTTIEKVIPPDSPLGLNIEIFNKNNTLECIIQFDQRKYSADYLNLIFERFYLKLNQIISQKNDIILSKENIPRSELEKCLVAFNQTTVKTNMSESIDSRFQKSAKHNPKKTAIIFQDKKISYSTLKKKIKLFTTFLISEGVTKDMHVSLLLDRSIEMIIAIFSVLKIGATYIPLDPTYPKKRIDYIIKNTSSSITITNTHLTHLINKNQSKLIDINQEWQSASMPSVSKQCIKNKCTLTDLAYIIYTSGSSGNPKGVMIKTQSLLNFLNAMTTQLNLTAQDTWLALTTVSFDISILELIYPLTIGSTIVLADSIDTVDGARINQLIKKNNVTVMQGTPTSWELLLNSPWKNETNLKILCGGEPLTTELKNRLCKKSNSCWNLYGPTETTIWSTIQKITKQSPVTIGKPIFNTKIYILNEDLSCCPIGTTGQIYIGGAGVSAGYVDNPKLTRQSFIVNPYQKNDIIYNTGDLGRWLPDGQIECLGRVDTQVKIRGFRIECKEIESCIESMDQISKAIVIPSEHNQHLRCFYSCNNSNQPTRNKIIEYVKTYLPSYMVPIEYNECDTFPTTPNNKIDKIALSKIKPKFSTTVKAHRLTATEKSLQIAWGKILNIKSSEITQHQNFFDCGGHSLIIPRLVDLIKKNFQVTLSIQDIFKHATIPRMATHIEEMRKDAQEVKNNEKPSQNQDHPISFHLLKTKNNAPSLTTKGKKQSTITILQSSISDDILYGLSKQIDSATITYIPAVSNEIGQKIKEIFKFKPALISTYSFTYGKIGLFLIPINEKDLFSNQALTIESLRSGIHFAEACGAKTISLAGLIPSVTNYGKEIETLKLNTKSKITTGHSTTTATIILTIEQIIAKFSINVNHETLGFCGLGSIGISSLKLFLLSFPHPKKIILCDLPAVKPILIELKKACINLGYNGIIEIVESNEKVPTTFYEAKLIIGATNKANILDIKQLKPGTIVIDDSIPHCFCSRAAYQRMNQKKDIICVEAGILTAPTDIAEERYVPKQLDKLKQFLPGIYTKREKNEITSCIFSSLLTQKFKDIPHTIGMVDYLSAKKHYKKCKEHKYTGTLLRLNGQNIPKVNIKRVKK